MDLTITTLKNNKYTLRVEPSDNIAEVKRRCEVDLKVGDASSIKMIYLGAVLKDDQTVEGIGIKPNEFLVMMISKKKKKKKTTEAKEAPTAASSSSNPPATTTTTTTPTTTASAPSSSEAVATSESSSTETKTSSSSGQADSQLVTGGELDGIVANLMALGYQRDQVVTALRAAFNNPNRAADYLMNGIPEHIQQQMNQQPQQQQQQPQQEQQQPPQQEQNSNQGQGQDQAAFQQNLLQAMQQQPQLLAPLMQQIAQSNPELGQLMQQNPQAFMQLVTQSLQQHGGEMPPFMGGGQGGQGGGDPQGHAIQVTEEEKAALDRLVGFGFPRHRVLEAFLICDRNEEMAANYLFDNAGQDENPPEQ